MDIYEKIEKYVAQKYGAVANETKKSIGDFMLSANHPVNVKSNNIDKNNYSPNMISAKRLVKWITDPANSLSFIFVDYKILNGAPKIIRDSGLIPVEHLSWKCMSIQAQGWGVIQLSCDLKIDKSQTRAQFLKGLRGAYEVFIQKERDKMAKIEQMIKGL